MSCLQPVISACFVFRPAAGRDVRTTIVVAPTAIKETTGRKTVVSWACSHGESCHNPKCVYARGGRDMEEV